MDKAKVKEILYKVFIKYHLLFVLLIFIDQLTKRLAVKYLTDNTITIFSWLLLKLSINDGVAFSFLSGAPQWITACFSIIATVAIEYILIKKKVNDKPLEILLLCLSAGALGNGIDRWLAVFPEVTGYKGVIDFIWPTFFANFNFADICVTLSCIGIVAYMIFSKDDSNEPTLKELREAKKRLKEQKEKEALEQQNNDLVEEVKEN